MTISGVRGVASSPGSTRRDATVDSPATGSRLLCGRSQRGDLRIHAGHARPRAVEFFGTRAGAQPRHLRGGSANSVVPRSQARFSRIAAA